MLRFEPKFGLSEIFSLIALILSGLALYVSHQSSLPHLRVQQRDAIVFIGGPPGSLNFAVPLSIVNSGGRTGTLTRIDRSGREPIVFTFRPDRAYVDDLSIDTRIALIPGSHNDTQQLADVFTNTRLIPAHLPYIADFPIEPGTQRSAALLVTMTDRNGRNLREEFVGFAVELAFSDGSTSRVAFANQRGASH